MKTSIPLMFALLFAVAVHAAGPETEFKPGLFDLKPTDPGKTRLPGLEQIAVIKTKEGFALATKATPTTWTLLGTTEGRGTFTAKPVNKNMKSVSLTITAIKSDGEFTGVLQQGAEAVTFTASFTNLGGLFRCGNHTPEAHLADGMTQMRELTKLKGCAQWSAESATSAAQTGIEALANMQQAVPYN